MKTAVLLFDLFSNYELSVALSVLSQAGRKYEVFALSEIVQSEEGLKVQRTKGLNQIDINEYDSLLVPGCMDLRGVIDNKKIFAFLNNFKDDKFLIACISSSPILLYKAGIIGDRKYIAGVTKEGLLEEGFTREELSNLRDITELKNADGSIDTLMKDGNLLSGIGVDFVNFGIEFGKLLNLEFESGWYKTGR